MDMTEIENNVRVIARRELEKATKFHGPHTSTHQAFGVLKEELEEAEKEKYKVDKKMRKLWNSVKNDDYERMENLIEKLETPMVNCIAESIQALAMVYKFQDYVKELNK